MRTDQPIDSIRLADDLANTLDIVHAIELAAAGMRDADATTRNAMLRLADLAATDLRGIIDRLSPSRDSYHALALAYIRARDTYNADVTDENKVAMEKAFRDLVEAPPAETIEAALVGLRLMRAEIEDTGPDENDLAVIDGALAYFGDVGAQ